MFDAAAASTLLPRATSCRTTSTTAVVLPVPVGRCIVDRHRDSAGSEQTGSSDQASWGNGADAARSPLVATDDCDTRSKQEQGPSAVSLHLHL